MDQSSVLKFLKGASVGALFAMILGALGTLASGCGDTNVNVQQPTNPNAPGQVPVTPTPAPTIINIQITKVFTPTPIIVQQNFITLIAKVVIVNNSTEEHSVVADDGHFNSGVIRPGETVEFDVDRPGDFPFHCGIHPGEKGILHVEAPETPPSPTPTLTEPVPTPTDTTVPTPTPTLTEPSPSPIVPALIPTIAPFTNGS